jgi:hypothetical protein
MKLVIAPWINQLIKYFWENKNTIIRNYYSKDYGIMFDFPNYCSLPEEICEHLSSDNVDILQSILTDALLVDSKKEFAQILCNHLAPNILKIK